MRRAVAAWPRCVGWLIGGPGMDPNADGGHPNVYLPLHATLAHGHWNWPENVSNAIELLLQVPSTVFIAMGI